MPKIKFLDSVKNKRKSLVVTHTEEDIVLNLPKESGTLVTDRFAEKKVKEANQGNQQNVTFILKPDITENNGGVTTSNWDEYFKIASYRTSAGFLGKHTGTEWVAYSDSNLTTIVDRSSGNVLHKDKWKPNTNTPNLNLYVKYRFVSNYIYSAWSDNIHVVTAPGGISPFDVSVEENTLTPLCTVSAFNAYGNANGANHASTSWVVYEANGESLGTKVIESLRDTTNKMNFRIPNGKLSADKEYYLQVTLHTDNSNYPNSKAYVRRFTTGSAYIERPVLKYEADNGRHIIKASDFTCSDSSQSLVSGVWKLYNADNNTLINSVTNTSKEYDITIFVNTRKKYYVTLVYKSNSLTSPEGRCVFTVRGGRADEITASFETSADKLPILKLSKFYIPGETDEVKSFVYNLTSDANPEGSELEQDWFNGKYNIAMEHTLEDWEYFNWVTKNFEREWDNPTVKIKGYLIGNKYNSEQFEASFTPNISLNYRVEHTATDLNNIKIRVVKDDSVNPSNPTPSWVTRFIFSVQGDKITTPVYSDESPTDSTEVLIPNNGYDYNTDYHFVVKVQTPIGIKSINHTIRVVGGKILDPDMTIEAKHAYGEYVNMKVKGNQYQYTLPIDSTNNLKEIKLTIQDTSDNNKVVYEQIQTVADKGPSVYNFDINHDKTQPDKSLKHGKKYLVSIEYKNNKDERSKRITKEFTTLEREEIVLPEINPRMYYNVNEIRYDQNPYLKTMTLSVSPYPSGEFAQNKLDKVIFRVKKPNGDLIKEHTITIDDYIAKRSNIKVDEFTTLSYYSDVKYDWEKLVRDQWNNNNTMYQNPYFELNSVYYLEVEFVRENVSKKASSRFVIMTRYGIGKEKKLKLNSIDNLILRREHLVMLEIDNPNIASGTLLTNQQVDNILSKDIQSTTPDLKLENVVFKVGKINNTYSIAITTNVRDPSKSGVVVKTIDNPREDPKFIAGINTFPIFTEAATTILTYNDVKPTIYVTYEKNKWYIVFKYLLFPRTIERNPDFIYPFNQGTFSNNCKINFDYKYKEDADLCNRDVTLSDDHYVDIWGWDLDPTYIARINNKDEDYVTKYVTTDKFIERTIELSKVRSYNYDVLVFPDDINTNYARGKIHKYPTPYLEYLPVDGCKLILALNDSSYLIKGKLDPADNLLIQPNQKNGVHYKIYKVNSDGTEIDLPNILDAFSVGIVHNSHNTEYNDYGSWTKSVNKRNVLEHGQLYKIKIWFIPYNNEMMSRKSYIEKYFIGYDSAKGDVNGPSDQKSIITGKDNRYNRLMNKKQEFQEFYKNYAPKGEFYGIKLVDADPLTVENGIQGIDSDATTLTETLMFSSNDKKLKRYIPAIYVYKDLNNLKSWMFASVGDIMDQIVFNYKTEPTSISCVWSDSTGNEHYYSRKVDNNHNLIHSDFYLKNPTPITPAMYGYGNGPTIIKTVISSESYEKFARYSMPENAYTKKTPLDKIEIYKDLSLGTIQIAPSELDPRLMGRTQDEIIPISETDANNVLNGSKTGDIANIVRVLPKKEDLYKPGYLLPANVASSGDFTIGEEHRLDIDYQRYSNAKINLVKQVPDWVKDTVQNGLPLIQDEHIKFTEIKNLPQEDIDKSKANFPLKPNEDKYVYKTLHIYKFAEPSDINIYGSDMFNMVSPLLRNLEGMKYSDVGLTKPGMITSVLKKDSLTTIAVFYRYGVENSKWIPAEVGFTNNNYMWPIYKHKIDDNNTYDITLPTPGNELRSIYRDIKFKSYVGNTVGTIETSSFYNTLAYDMIAIVFKYNRFRLYSIIYYRVDRTTGEMSYHKEDQNIVFNQETSFGGGLDLPLMSNKAMCFLHAVKPNGDIVRHPEVPAAEANPGTGTIPTEVIGKIRYVVDELHDNWSYGQLVSYLFIEPIPNIKKYESIGHGSSDWAALELVSTDPNQDGYVYGTGYTVTYKNIFINETVYRDDTPDMKIRLTDTSNQIIRLDIKLGNFKQNFPSGKEYEAIITPGTD